MWTERFGNLRLSCSQFKCRLKCKCKMYMQRYDRQSFTDLVLSQPNVDRKEICVVTLIPEYYLLEQICGSLGSCCPDRNLLMLFIPNINVLTKTVIVSQFRNITTFRENTLTGHGIIRIKIFHDFLSFSSLIANYSLKKVKPIRNYNSSIETKIVDCMNIMIMIINDHDNQEIVDLPFISSSWPGCH